MLSVDTWVGWVILFFMILHIIPSSFWDKLFGHGALEPDSRRWIGVEQDCSWSYDVPVRVESKAVKQSREWTGTDDGTTPADEIPF